MKPYARFNRATFPIITVTFTGAKATPENFQVYLDGLLENYTKKEPFALIFDANAAAMPTAYYQKWQAKWLKDNEKLIQTYCKGVAYVIPNPILRSILKIMILIQRHPVAFKVFGSMEEGQKWANIRLALHGVDV